MIKYLLFFVLLAAFLDEGSSMNYTQIKDNLDRGSIALSGQFIYQLSQSRPDENFATSPTSILVPLAQITLFARCLVLRQLLKVLNLCSKDQIKTVYPQVTADYKNQQEVEFELATKYYVNENYELSETFINDSQVYFDAYGENIDFGDNEEAADIINAWVSNKTRDRIQDLVSPDSLDSNTIVVLVNAIYFLGNWVHQFNPNDTEKRDFTKRNGDVVQLDTMYQKNRFNYAENIPGLNVQALEMPYKNRNFSCLLILPEEGYYDDTIKALLDPDVFNNVLDSLSYNEVQVSVPKMNITTDLDMADMLKKVNVTKMFDPSYNGFKGILKDDDQRLYVSSAVQKVVVLFDETGTEAAAATAIAVGASAGSVNPSKTYIFNLHRPFIFYILFERVPMFCSAFVGAS